jgi:hypothetical protein
MSEWITDRLPTANDAEDGRVWVYFGNFGGEVRNIHWSHVLIGTPWQPIQRPAPYVKPKRWTVEFDSDYNLWFAYDRRSGSQCTNVFAQLGRNELDAAQRIEDLFNEVMP